MATFDHRRVNLRRFAHVGQAPCLKWLGSLDAAKQSQSGRVRQICRKVVVQLKWPVLITPFHHYLQVAWLQTSQPDGKY